MAKVLYISPFLNTETIVTYNRCSSSQRTESYSANGASFSLFLTSDAWEFNVLTGIKLFDYDWYPGDYGSRNERKDIRINGGAGVSYFVKKYEFFIKADIMKNDSDINDESYLRRVLQCGVSFVF